MDISVSGTYASIKGMRWDGVPPLAVVTGPNGAGKSQLLRAIYLGLDVGKLPDELSHGRLKTTISDIQFQRGEVFFSRGEWPDLVTRGVNSFEVTAALQNLVSRRRGGILKSLSAALNRSEVALGRMTPPEFVSILTPSVFWAHTPERANDISFLFLAHRVLEKMKRDETSESASVVESWGPPPWDALSEVILTAGLPFKVSIPDPIYGFDVGQEASFRLEVKNERGELVPLESLSSGERVLMSTVLWIYKAQATGVHFKLILLDEPDAHLHPSLTRHFIRLIQEAFVERRGVQVIITTHSPSTVSLVPQESLFEISRENPGTVLPADRSKVVMRLTGGFVAIQDATRTVLVEGKCDPAFYRIVWSLLTVASHGRSRADMSSYPPISFVHGQGKHTVLELVPQLRSGGYTNFFGIVDKDRIVSRVEGVGVLSRYSIESYLFDPLVLWQAQYKKGVRLEALGEGVVPLGGISALRPEALQACIDEVVKNIEREYPPDNRSAKVRVPVNYTNGVQVEIPDWCMTWKKSELRGRVGRVLGQFSDEDLLRAYLDVGLVTTDLRDMLLGIQGAQS